MLRSGYESCFIFQYFKEEDIKPGLFFFFYFFLLSGGIRFYRLFILGKLLWPFQGGAPFVDRLCLVFVVRLRLFVAAL